MKAAKPQAAQGFENTLHRPLGLELNHCAGELQDKEQQSRLRDTDLGKREKTAQKIG